MTWTDESTGSTDVEKIQWVLTTYSRAIDRLDVELLKSIYHPEARDSHAAFEGTAREFADYVIPYLRDTFESTMHHVTHSNIEVQGNYAAAESYYYAYHAMSGDPAKMIRFFGQTYTDRCIADGTIEAGHEFICGGRYVDRFEKREGVWRIFDREITVEWKHFRPRVDGDAGSEIAAIHAPPGRDRADLAYGAVDWMRDRARQAANSPK